MPGMSRFSSWASNFLSLLSPMGKGPGKSNHELRQTSKALSKCNQEFKLALSPGNRHKNNIKISNVIISAFLFQDRFWNNDSLSASSALDGIKEEVKIFNNNMGKVQSWTKVLSHICICCTFLNYTMPNPSTQPTYNVGACEST